MKKLAIILSLFLTVFGYSFAQQNDFQMLAVVKHNGSESISLKNLKDRIAFLQKQYEPMYGKVNFTVEQKKEILENLINEKLLVQAAKKENITVTDSEVDNSFLNVFAQSLGMQLTEAQLSSMIQEQTGKTLDEYLLENTGITKKEYKNYLKNQLTSQKYVYVKKMDSLKNVKAEDKEIRNAYEMNKKQFAWDDMQKLFLVIVPKNGNDISAREKAVEMRLAYTKDKKAGTNFINSKDNGKLFAARNLVVSKSTNQAQQLGWSYEKIIELFDKQIGYVSDVTETDNDFQFYVILEKYQSKLLGLSDIVHPDSNITVYEYIKSNLTQQKQAQYFELAAKELSEELATSSSVDRKVTGEKLNNLLNW